MKSLVLPAYDFVVKAAHAFNVLDARGAIGVTERQRFDPDRRGNTFRQNGMGAFQRKQGGFNGKAILSQHMRILAGRRGGTPGLLKNIFNHKYAF